MKLFLQNLALMGSKAKASKKGQAVSQPGKFFSLLDHLDGGTAKNAGSIFTQPGNNIVGKKNLTSLFANQNQKQAQTWTLSKKAVLSAANQGNEETAAKKLAAMKSVLKNRLTQSGEQTAESEESKKLIEAAKFLSLQIKAPQSQEKNGETTKKSGKDKSAESVIATEAQAQVVGAQITQPQTADKAEVSQAAIDKIKALLARLRGKDARTVFGPAQQAAAESSARAREEAFAHLVAQARSARRGNAETMTAAAKTRQAGDTKNKTMGTEAAALKGSFADLKKAALSLAVKSSSASGSAEPSMTAKQTTFKGDLSALSAAVTAVDKEAMLSQGAKYGNGKLLKGEGRIQDIKIDHQWTVVDRVGKKPDRPIGNGAVMPDGRQKGSINTVLSKKAAALVDENGNLKTAIEKKPLDLSKVQGDGSGDEISEDLILRSGDKKKGNIQIRDSAKRLAESVRAREQQETPGKILVDEKIVDEKVKQESFVRGQTRQAASAADEKKQAFFKAGAIEADKARSRLQTDSKHQVQGESNDNNSTSLAQKQSARNPGNGGENSAFQQRHTPFSAMRRAMSAVENGKQQTRVENPAEFSTSAFTPETAKTGETKIESALPKSLQPMMEKLTEGMHRAMALKPRAVTVKLNPAELGQVEIQVKLEKEKLSAQIKTESAKTAQLLRDASPELDMRLKNAGLQFEKVDIYQRERGQDHGQSMQDQNQQSRQDEGQGRHQGRQEQQGNPSGESFQEAVAGIGRGKGDKAFSFTI